MVDNRRTRDGTEPVVVNSSASIHNDRVALSDENRERVDYEGLVFDTVGFDDSEVVAIERDGEEGPAGNVDKTEAIF